MEDCIFCKIVKGEAEASVIEESENVIAFKSIDPVAAIHILVVPKKHLETFMSLGGEDKDLLSEMVEMAQGVIAKTESEDAYRLSINGGKYQGIGHLHLHVLGGELSDDYQEKI